MEIAESPVFDRRSDWEGHSARTEVSSSGVSWGAVLGGASVATAMSLILLALGAGLGLSFVSPWASAGANAAKIGIVAIVWVIVTQMVASALGGYMTGRLRTKWAMIHTDEVFFRDTANGLMMWAVGLVITVAFLTAAGTAMLGGAATGATAAATGAAAQSAEPNAYFVDTLFRADRPVDSADTSIRNDASTRAEAGRIFSNGLLQPDIPAADRAYLARLISARTGLSPGDADKRVSDVIGDARQTADTARKAAVYSLLWIFIALLIGAFCASYFATIGGRIRDHVKVV
jgi:hypothetical protein